MDDFSPRGPGPRAVLPRHEPAAAQGQVEFFAAALGGPHEHRGRTMKEVHRGRGIERRHFDLVAKYLIEALLAAGVPQPAVDAIVGAVAPLADDVVAPA
ncbi:group I truncated hemoglobin [Amycolatopsis rubida]|uniref:group I truncated hemoglobin n=1 Tax=Amycolatopsis rubida TaxID=112413 RepID=UPI000A550B54|nr:group 1 truncated hemoglobin [Amycolatopsis rubida]